MVRLILVHHRNCLIGYVALFVFFLLFHTRLTAAYQDSFIHASTRSADVPAKFGSFPVLLIDEIGEIGFKFERVQLS